MELDYLDYRNKGLRYFDSLTEKVKAFVQWIDEEINTRIDFVGTGPPNEEIIDRRSCIGVKNLERELASMSRR